MEEEKFKMSDAMLKLLVDVYTMPEFPITTEKNREIIIAKIEKTLGEDIDIIEEFSTNEDIEKEVCISIIKKLNDALAFQTKITHSIAMKAMKNYLIETNKQNDDDSQLDFLINAQKSIVNSKLTDYKNSHKICYAFSTDISIRETEEKVNKIHITRISQILKISEESIKVNECSGANKGFIVSTKNNVRYFVKTFSEAMGTSNEALKKIDCCEMFAYKVLEYLGFGPETKFLITPFSSSQGSIAKVNYIMTRDVESIGMNETNIKEKKFFRDLIKLLKI
jgi:hypothetical protein